MKIGNLAEMDVTALLAYEIYKITRLIKTLDNEIKGQVAAWQSV